MSVLDVVSDYKTTDLFCSGFRDNCIPTGCGGSIFTEEQRDVRKRLLQVTFLRLHCAVCHGFCPLTDKKDHSSSLPVGVFLGVFPCRP